VSHRLSRRFLDRPVDKAIAIAKAIQEKKQIGYKEVCACKPNCGKMECFT